MNLMNCVYLREKKGRILFRIEIKEVGSHVRATVNYTQVGKMQLNLNI